MDLQKLQTDYRSLIEAANTKAAEWKGREDEMPQEVSDEIDGLLGRADETMARIDLAKRLGAANQGLEEPQPTQAAHMGWRNAGPREGMPDIDPQAWRKLAIPITRVDPVLGVVVQTERELRYHVPLAVQAKGYTPAFEAYLHKGLGDLGPQDRKTLTEGADSAGGFLVPEDYQAELIKKMMTMATIRARARVVTTSRDIATWPKVHYTTDDKYTSGVRLTWTGESPASSTAHRVTDPVFGLYAIPVHTAMASMPLSNDLIEDSAFDVVGVSSDMIAEAFVLGENDAFINGTGIARPMGILAQVDGDGPASVVSGTASTLTADGIINLWAALPSQYETNAVWIMSKATEAVIRKLKNTDGDYLWPIVSAVGNLGAAARNLLDFPTLRDEFMPAIAAAAYPILFGDLTGYLVLDRVGLSVQRLTERYAEENITLLLARKRVGGQVVEPWRLKAQKVGA